MVALLQKGVMKRECGITVKVRRCLALDDGRPHRRERGVASLKLLGTGGAYIPEVLLVVKRAGDCRRRKGYQDGMASGSHSGFMW